MSKAALHRGNKGLLQMADKQAVTPKWQTCSAYYTALIPNSLDKHLD